MKTLYLLRHAKSAWDLPQLGDRERALNRRGQRDAPAMGAALSALMPAMAIAVSPARRAQLTLEGLCEGWPALADCQHVSDEALYTFASGDLLQWIARQDDGHSAVFLLGHNPALTDLINTLAGSGTLSNLPTAGFAQLALPIERWNEMGEQPGTVVRTLFPRQLSRDRSC